MGILMCKQHYVESYASMNMWGLTPEFMQTLENGVYWKDLFENLKQYRKNNMSSGEKLPLCFYK